MSFSYEPLWNMLNELNISKMDFAKMIDISNATLAKLSKNEPITLTTVDKICNRFNCNIENVVRHIKDIQITQANFIVEKGMIVLADDISQRIPVFINDDKTNIYKDNMRPHIILDVIYHKKSATEKIIRSVPYSELMYIIAPIYTSINNNSPLYVPFNDVIIDGSLSNGFVAFGNLSVVSSGLFKKKLGVMPDKYMQKFEQILFSLKQIFDDIEP